MNKNFLSVLTFMLLVLTGCGGNHDNPPPPFVTQILSDSNHDSDIARVANTGTFIINQGTAQSYYSGFDPADGAELRAFLQFPLAEVPGNAIIASATLDLFINSIQPNQQDIMIPIRIDLVDLQPPTLVANDFDRTLQPALATTMISPPISQADFGKHVFVDVTALMREAQHLGLPSFQIRILRDPGATFPGLIEINDTTGINRSTLAPLLDVSYF